MQNGIDEVYDEPGLQSVASATVTPASMSLRASGYGERVENSAPGSRVATTPEEASASTSASDRWVQWSAEAAPSSQAIATPGPSPSCPACTRAASPARIPAERMCLVCSPSKAPRSQKTSIHLACGAQASSIGPATSRT